MEEKVPVEGLDKVELMFDTLLTQTVKKGITYEEYLERNERGEFYGEFEQLNSWKRLHGYKFSIYNDHLIDHKRHFHLDNSERNVHLKVDFDGEILEDKGKNRIDKAVYKILIKFLKQKSVIEEMDKMWNKNNQK